jgi:group I intron endonuclease
MSVEDFPGYNKVLITFRQLCIIIREEITSWKAALKSVSGIYIITDTKNGKVYIGSACGEQGLWQRWATYAKNGHGGNKDLKALLKKKGAGYPKNFQFSILEVTDLNANEEHIIERENHWKNLLMSREYGYNQN